MSGLPLTPAQTAAYHVTKKIMGPKPGNLTAASQELAKCRGHALVTCREMGLAIHVWLHVFSVVTDLLKDKMAEFESQHGRNSPGWYTAADNISKPHVQVVGLDELRRAMLHKDKHLAYFEAQRIEDWVSTAYRLTVIKIGTGVGQPDQDNRALEESLRHAEAKRCNVWLVQDPRRVLNEKHPAWSIYLSDWLEHHGLMPVVVDDYVAPTMASIVARSKKLKAALGKPDV